MSYKLDASKFERDGMLKSDAGESVFFLRQLEEIDGQLYNVKYARLEAMDLLDVHQGNPGAETYTYRQYDGVAIGEFSSNYANGSPRADVSGKEFSIPYKSVRASYGYNIQEIRAANMGQFNLEAERALKARRAIDEAMNTAALLGNTATGMKGLFNQASANSYTVPADGTGASALWSAKTADLILRDMFGIVDTIPTVTKELENATHLLLPYARLRTISTKRVDSVNNTTVLEFFQKNRPLVQVRGALYLDTAGASSVARMVAYCKSPMHQKWVVSVPFESFPPQLQGMEYVVECHGRMGGVVSYYPLSIAYGDGI